MPIQTHFAIQATGGFVIIPDDVVLIRDSPTNLKHYGHCALYIGGAGDLNAVMADGTTVLFVGLLAGTFVPVQVVQVLAASTTCTNIVGLVNQE